MCSISGHECGGLTIGYKTALYAIDLLGLSFSPDENVVCVSENDACGVYAIQVLLGCSVGKGNLLFYMRGKQAYHFYERNSGKAVRLVLKPTPEKMTSELFEVTEAKIKMPEKARLFNSYVCDCCGEKTGENWIRFQGDKKLCLDCFIEYDRFKV